MNSFCRRSISQLRRTSQTTTTTKTHRIFLLNLNSHYATKPTTKSSKPLKPKTSATDSAPPPPRRSWTVFINKPTEDSPSPSPLPSPAEWARPSEIPFQAKVANSVHLVGYVRAPVRFHITPDGSSWSSTVITQNISSENDNHDDHGDDDAFPESLPLWVPVIFEGDLAHVAASHLKENDRVYVTGKLSASLPHLNANQVQASIQVLAHDLNFIGEAVQTIKSSAPCKQEKGIWNNSDSVNKDKSDLSSWMDLLENPKQWWDNRDRKRNRSVSPKYPDFTHKDDRRGLWLNTAPQSVLVELEGLQLDAQIRKSTEDKQLTASTMKDGDSASWRDLIDNSEKWWDYRHGKLDGLVNPKFPDFKRKDGSLALWLSSAPQWVSSQLKGLKFDVKIQKSKAVVKASKVDELWKDLVEHPEKWWDNRLQKLNEKHPDFKHKETGDALWLGGSPTWVLSKLPPPKSKKVASFGKRDTLLS